MIGKINAEYVRRVTDDSGAHELTFKVDPSSRFAVRLITDELNSLKKSGESTIVLTIDQYRSRRSLAQNRMMWELLEIMAKALNGGRTGGVTAWDCYLDMLEKYGGKFEYIQCQKKALPTLKDMFRQIRVVEEREKDTVMCKCYVGSSKFNTKEMKMMIDGLLDELESMDGVDAAALLYLREEWRNAG